MVTSLGSGGTLHPGFLGPRQRAHSRAYRVDPQKTRNSFSISARRADKLSTPSAIAIAAVRMLRASLPAAYVDSRRPSASCTAQSLDYWLEQNGAGTLLDAFSTRDWCGGSHVVLSEAKLGSPTRARHAHQPRRGDHRLLLEPIGVRSTSPSWYADN